MKALSGVMVMVAVMVAVAEGLFDFVGVDCAEASDSSRFTAQPHRHPPSSIINRINLAAIIGAQPMFRHARPTRRRYHRYGQNDVLQPYDLPVTGGGARKTLEVHQRVGQ